MKNTLKHRGYDGSVYFDADDRLFHGRVLGINDMITFEGDTVDALEEDFRKAVEDYLVWCQERDKEPGKPFSGRFVLRMSPEMHAQIASVSSQANKSINTWIVDVLRSFLDYPWPLHHTAGDPTPAARRELLERC